MSDRYHSLTVVLQKDIRDDDAVSILNAIRMIKGVMSVKGNISGVDYHVAEMRANAQLRDKLYELCKTL